MMKKLLALLLAAMMILSLSACGGAKNEPAASSEGSASSEQQETQTPDDGQQADAGETAGTEWPDNTMFPAPEGCTIVEIRSEDWKNYITVEWDSKEAAKEYIEVVKSVEGDGAEVIGQGETDDEIYYGTYGVTITSMNEAENIVLYK